jgi:hypothetical protein
MFIYHQSSMQSCLMHNSPIIAGVMECLYLLYMVSSILVQGQGQGPRGALQARDREGGGCSTSYSGGVILNERGLLYFCGS